MAMGGASYREILKKYFSRARLALDGSSVAKIDFQKFIF
jgi:hypothetical protein